MTERVSTTNLCTQKLDWLTFVERDERFTIKWTESIPQIRGFLVALTGDIQMADDVLQDVAIVLLRQFDDYDPNRPFVAWAMRVARNKAVDALRSRARSPLVFSNDLVESAVTAWQELLPELEQRTNALQDCLATMVPRTREILRLRYEINDKPRTIAEKLGMSAVAVRVALNRARVLLRDCIEARTTGLRPVRSQP